ncbi:Arc family DNA-binding protein [Hafnia paralvei]|uniref:Arc family DNA-binding protein n=1 Tax=Hafnia paralvei TaxID=546367 RepID=UPI0038D15308
MSDKENPAFVERFTVRMPDGLRDAIAERAKKNGRSMNSEIVQILQDALEGNELPPAYHLDEVSGLDPAEEAFYSLSREEQIKQIEAADPLQAAIERITDSYSKKMMYDVKKAIKELSKKPT